MMSLPSRRTIATVALGALIAVVAPASGHVRLLAPNGGELLKVGCPYTITWQIQIAHDTQNWDLWYSRESSNGPWTEIASDLPAGDTSQGSIHEYEWVVPYDVSEQAYVRVRMDNSGTDYYDVSDSANTIEPIEGDIDGDGQVGHSDLGLLLSAWGTCDGDDDYLPEADLDGSGCVDHSDLGILLSAWGATCA